MDVPVGRKEFRMQATISKSAGNKIQASRNKIQIGRNKIQMTRPATA
jgi:hypothetical protein